MNKKRFYVYTLAYPNGTVFYVGKGSKSRIENHTTDAINFDRPHTYNTKKSQIIRQIWRDGGKVLKEKIGFFDDEQEALAFEAETIKSFPPEQLANIKHTEMRAGYKRLSDEAYQRAREIVANSTRMRIEAETEQRPSYADRAAHRRRVNARQGREIL